MNNRFKYNPFSGILEDDIEKILVPKFNLDNIVSKINNSDSLNIEFLGKQGRGKTTHLIYLQKQMTEYPIFLLNSSSTITDIINDKASIVFIDSIHHLNIFDRIRLFKIKEKVIYTTHLSRKLDCFLARKDNYSIKFKGIDKEILREVLNKRLQLASYKKKKQETFTENEIKLLIQKFGDNYRGIINYLYEKYQ
ncbi:hypothetical protein CXF68_19025 [Tenacibaculum sp. Bg11-29]|uniref:hypothetical protein n=1 Tax=Tenacibaculum sp. Bg11-29 TaxID=2058306 RepID=UPI000C32F59D|nr:hypothetical protein [Tenacibaculum sp. Bg11-29]PKH52666.1 hypothetical protein CXF68_19025 [Tenacibaculum sp. Bg11-29]